MAVLTAEELRALTDWHATYMQRTTPLTPRELIELHKIAEEWLDLLERQRLEHERSRLHIAQVEETIARVTELAHLPPPVLEEIVVSPSTEPLTLGADQDPRRARSRSQGSRGGSRE